MADSMQFFLNTKVDVDDLIDTLSHLLNVQVETLEQPHREAKAFLMLIDYQDGFPLGLTISMQPDVVDQHDSLAIAKHLAMHYNTLVATDLPENSPNVHLPYHWCLIQPDGVMFEVAEDTSLDLEERDGLVLDHKTKHPI